MKPSTRRGEVEWTQRNAVALVGAILLTLGLCARVHAQGTSALPQPDIILYGTVLKQPVAEAVVPVFVTWAVAGNNESITSSNTTIVTVNTETFYISRIPFETRQIVGGPALPATPNVLELTQTDTTYTRRVTVDGKAAVVPAGKGTFFYGASSLGLIERIDLVIGETYDEWSHRIFGSVVGRDEDADNDGRTNREEWLHGTDPQSASSLSIVRSFAPRPGGGFTITWDSLVDRTYSIEKSASLQEQDWEVVGGLRQGTGEPMQYTHPAGSERRLFFRIGVSEPEP